MCLKTFRGAEFVVHVFKWNLARYISSTLPTPAVKRMIVYYHCMLGNISYLFLPSADFLKIKLTLSKNYFNNIIRVSNSLDPDQARHLVGPDLGSNCLQRISADG